MLGLLLHLQTSRFTYFHTPNKLDSFEFYGDIYYSYQICIHPVLKGAGIF